jgi:hypothetical protein
MSMPERERGWLYGYRPDESNIDLMLTEIVGGIRKAEARSIRGDADAALWDCMAEDVARILAQGHIVVCDNGADDTDD